MDADLSVSAHSIFVLLLYASGAVIAYSFCICRLVQGSSFGIWLLPCLASTRAVTEIGLWLTSRCSICTSHAIHEPCF
jgi:hypothetical protein